MHDPAHTFRPEPGSVPDSAGCYLFRDSDGRVVYVGKAKSLRARLANYFQSSTSLAPRTRAMLSAASGVEWIVVDTEVDALLLEHTLIQRHRPRYNVQYRDDKSYPYLVLSTSQPVPRARVARGRIADADRAFGPYAHAYAIRETLDLLLPIFPVRTCSDGVYRRAAQTGRACLLYHIDRCAGPCVGAVSHQEHRGLVDGLASFLDGGSAPVLRDLEAAMRRAADEQQYEFAARRRDQLDAARKALAQQQVVSERDEDFDVIGVHEDTLEAAIQVLFVRHGRLSGRKGWTVDKVEPVDTAELLRRFLVELYAERSDDIPGLIVVPVAPNEPQVVVNLLTDRRRQASSQVPHTSRRTATVAIRVPQRGGKRQLLDTATDNAREAFQRARLRRATDFEARTRALRELQAALDLASAPLRIECYDISHLSGTQVVGSMVVFEDGLPKKADYRRFKLSIDRNDDFAAMREVITRRFRQRVSSEASQDRFAVRPDLIIVDGGAGQLSAACEGAADSAADVSSVAFVALAKRHEELWLPQRRQPVMLARGSDALYLVQRIRDEAHRFAVTYQRQRRSAALTRSELDDIPGIGPARRRQLLATFGSVRAIASADRAEIARVQGISLALADGILDHLRAGQTDEGTATAS